MSLSIVIPNLHSPLIGAAIAALRVQTAIAGIQEIIVVGMDRYQLIVPDQLVRSCVTERPISAAAARNLGAQIAKGDYLLFLDADCIAAPNLVERIQARHQQGYAIVGGGVTIETEHYWTLCDNLLVFAPFLSTAAAGPRAYLTSQTISIARQVFTQCNGFDETFAPTGEDMDLSLRLRAQGYELFFDPLATVAHRPPRRSARAIWQHLRSFGRGYYRVQQHHRSALHSPLAGLPRQAAGLLMALIPLLACKNILSQFAGSPALRAYPQAIVGMLWGRMGWYLGVVEALLAHPQHRDADLIRR